MVVESASDQSAAVNPLSPYGRDSLQLPFVYTPVAIVETAQMPMRRPAAEQIQTHGLAAEQHQSRSALVQRPAIALAQREVELQRPLERS